MKSSRERKKYRRPKPLSPEEVERAVEKIRKEWNDLIIGYMLSPRIKESFEERYIDALRARIDMASFLSAEMRAIRELREQKEQLRMAEENRKMAAEQRRERQKRGEGKQRHGFADRVLQELRSRIEKYPGIGLRWEESMDLDRLYGAARLFEREFWPGVAAVFRRIYPSRYSGPTVELENELFEFTGYGSDGYPPRLYGYINCENRVPRNERQLHQESMRCILELSFFLHDLEAAMQKLMKQEHLDGDELQQVERAADFVHTVKEDFRLHDLKRRKE